MAFTFIGSGGAYGDTGSGAQVTLSVPLPAGSAAGDLALAFGVSTFQSTGGTTGDVVVTSSGWTKAANAGVGSNGGSLFWKILTASDTSFNSVSNATSSRMTVGVLVYRAPNISFGSATSGTGASGPAPAISSTKVGQKALIFQQDSVATKAGSPAAPSGWTTRLSPYAATSSAHNTGAFERNAETTGAGALPTTSLDRTYASSDSFVFTALISQNVTPNAPTLTAPADTATVNRSATVTHTWTPSDPEGDPQAGYDLRYRIAGTTSDWTVVANPTAGTTASYTAPARQYAGNVEWQVRTYDAVGPGAWSTSRTFSALETGTPTPSQAVSQVDPLSLLAYAQHGTNRGNLQSYATADLPAEGPVGRQVYDTTVGQVKVKTAPGTATYLVVGASTAGSGTFSESTLQVTAGTPITRRYAVPSGARRAIVMASGVAGYGLVALATTASAERRIFWYAGSNGGGVSSQSGSYVLSPTGVSAMAFLSDLYIDTGTSELVVTYTATNGTASLTIAATYEVF